VTGHAPTAAPGLVLIGPSGDAADAAAVLARLVGTPSAYTVLGRLEDRGPDPDPFDDPDLPLLGRLDDPAALARTGAALVHVATADPARRRAIVDRLPAGLAAPLLVDPSAIIAPGCDLAEGSLVAAHAFVSAFVTLGRHVQVGPGTGVGHDAVIGEFATLAAGASLLGGVVIGDGAVIGSRAVVLEGVRVGPGAVIRPGAVVNRDVLPGMILAGIPARPVAVTGATGPVGP